MSRARHTPGRMSGRAGARPAALLVVIIAGAAAALAQGLKTVDVPLPELLTRRSSTSLETPNGGSRFPRFSLDGRRVALESDASDLDPGDTDPRTDIYVLERERMTYLRASDGTVPGRKKGDSSDPSIDASGNLVTFTSDGTDLIREDVDPIPDVYLKDLAANRLTLVSAQRDDALGVIASGNDVSDQAEISDDGQWITFRSRAGNLGLDRGQQPLEFFHIHLYLVQDAVTTRINGAPGATQANGDSFDPDLSFDGKVVVFATDATGFTPEDQDRVTDIVLMRQSDPSIFELVSVDSQGEKFPGPSTYPRISVNGRFVAFSTRIDNVDHIAVRNVEDRDTRIVSRDWLGDPAAGPNTLGDLSPDGSLVVFTSRSPLTPDDGNTEPDTYARDILRDRTLLLSRSPRSLLAAGSTFTSGNGAVTGDPAAGEYEVAFFSRSRELASDVNDLNDADDIFAIDVTREAGPPEQAFAPSNALHLPFVTGPGSSQIRRVVLMPGGGLPVVDKSAVIDVASFEALAVTAANILWVLDGATLRPFSAATLQESSLPVIPVPIDAAQRVHAMTAFGGSVYIAAGSTIIKVTPASAAGAPEVASIDFPGDPVAVSLAGDPEGRLWVGARGDGRFDLIRIDKNFRPDLRIVRDFPALARLGTPYHHFAIDAEGALVVRSVVEVAKLAPNGNVAWRQFLPPGDGLAIDGFGNSYVVAGNRLVSLAPDGRERFSADLSDAGIPLDAGGFELALDGASDLWIIARGAPEALRITRPGEDSNGQINLRIDRIDLDEPVALTNHSDFTGFVAANVTGQGFDSDRDNFRNRREVLALDNPFDPTPPPAGRFPAIRDFIATLEDGSVRLDWRSPEPFPFFLIRRNGRPIAQVTNNETIFVGVDRYRLVDDSPVGGVNRYVIIGLLQKIELLAGLRAADGGAGAPDGAGAGPPPPQSEPAESIVIVGQGEELSVNDELDGFFGEEATAIAVDDDADTVYAATSTRLAEFDIFSGGGVPGLILSDWTDFPGGFPSDTITGVEIDPNDATVIYLLQRDGQLYSIDLDDNPLVPALEADLMAGGNAPAGWDSHEHYGLALAGDTFFTVQNSFILASIEPGVDCLIGWGKNGGPPGTVTARRTVSGPGSVFPCRESSWTGGLAPINGGTSLLAGLGGTTTTIDEVSAIDLTDLGGGAFDFDTGTTGLGLDADTYNMIFDFAPGEFDGQEFLAFTASSGRIVLVGAEFPVVQSSTLDVQRIHYPDSQDLGILVSYGGTGKTFAELNLGILVDGEEPTLDDAPVVDAGASEATFVIPFDETPKYTRRFTVSVRSTEGAATCEFIRGFIRGDANDDGNVDVSDAVRILLWLFVGGGVELPCKDAANVNDDTDTLTGENKIEQTDAIALLNHLFISGPPPARPFPEFGVDPTADDTTECE